MGKGKELEKSRSDFKNHSAWLKYSSENRSVPVKTDTSKQWQIRKYQDKLQRLAVKLNSSDANNELLKQEINNLRITRLTVMNAVGKIQKDLRQAKAELKSTQAETKKTNDNKD